MSHGRYRLKGFDYRSNRWYFVTTVTAARRHSLGRIEGTDFYPSAQGRIVQEEIANLSVRRPNVKIPISAVMPNHVHLLLGIANEGTFEEEGRFGKVASDSLATIVGGWKAGVTRRLRQEIAEDQGEIWQRRFHDRVVRNEVEWEAVSNYILWNQVTWHVDPLNRSREPTAEEISDWKRRHDL